MARLNEHGVREVWPAPLDHHAPPHQENLQGDLPIREVKGEIFFRETKGIASFIYRVNEGGTGLRRAVEQPMVTIVGLSPDGQWLLARPVSMSPLIAFPLGGGAPVRNIPANTPLVAWSPDSRSIFITVSTRNTMQSTAGHTYVLPLREDRCFRTSRLRASCPTTTFGICLGCG